MPALVDIALQYLCSAKAAQQMSFEPGCKQRAIMSTLSGKKNVLCSGSKSHFNCHEMSSFNPWRHFHSWLVKNQEHLSVLYTYSEDLHVTFNLIHLSSHLLWFSFRNKQSNVLQWAAFASCSVVKDWSVENGKEQKKKGVWSLSGGH